MASASISSIMLLHNVQLAKRKNYLVTS